MANGWQTRDYQTHAHDAVYHQFLEQQCHSTLVVMPTGTGKTVLAARIAQTNATVIGEDAEPPERRRADRHFVPRGHPRVD
jgi:ERCC4-related helicase